MKKILLILTLISLFLLPIASSLSTTWGDAAVTNPSHTDGAIVNDYNLSSKQLGISRAVDLKTFSYTDSSTNASMVNESPSLKYGSGSSLGSETSHPTRTGGHGLTNTSSTTYSFDVSSVDGTYWVQPTFDITFRNNTVSGINASFTSISLTFENDLSDVLTGMPQVGSDIGSFLKRLAPGVGVFILIIGVFGGVAGIIYAVISVIKSKFDGGME